MKQAIKKQKWKTAREEVIKIRTCAESETKKKMTPQKTKESKTVWNQPCKRISEIPRL